MIPPAASEIVAGRLQEIRPGERPAHTKLRPKAPCRTLATGIRTQCALRLTFVAKYYAPATRTSIACKATPRRMCGESRGRRFGSRTRSGVVTALDDGSWQELSLPVAQRHRPGHVRRRMRNRRRPNSAQRNQLRSNLPLRTPATDVPCGPMLRQPMLRAASSPIETTITRRYQCAGRCQRVRSSQTACRCPYKRCSKAQGTARIVLFREC